MKKVLLGLVVAFGLLAAIHAEPAESGADSKPSQVVSEKTHWMTASSQKRHRSGCRYFKKSDGRMCTPDEGIACKKCGG